MIKYAFTKYDPATMARAANRDVGISFKKSVMIAQKLRGMMSDKALAYLGRVQAQKEAVPFTRFRNGAGHKPGAMAAGKYPVKAAAEFAALLEQAVANAENKGLGTPLRIVHIVANEAARPLRAGRKRSQATKRTHLELVLVETDESKKREKRPKKAKKKEKEAPQEASAPKQAPQKAQKEASEEKNEASEKKETVPTPVEKTDVKKEIPKKKEAPEQPVKPVPKTAEKPAAKPTEPQAASPKKKEVTKDGN